VGSVGEGKGWGDTRSVVKLYRDDTSEGRTVTTGNDRAGLSTKRP